jgi:hypothetical protein
MIVVAAAIMIALFFDDADNKPQPAVENIASNNKTALTASDTSTFYAVRADDNSWPKISENSVVQTDDLTDKNYYLVFDGSGSMEEGDCSNGKTKIAVAKTAVTRFINKIPDNANVGLTIFDSYGNYERTKLGKGQKESAIQLVKQVIEGGGTPLRSAIKYAYNSLSTQAVKQLGYGEYHLVVITDGKASGGQDPSKIVRNLLIQSPVVLHTIGFCIRGGHSLNQEGNTFYKSANNPEQLDAGLDSVLAEAPDFQVDTFEGQSQ